MQYADTDMTIEISDAATRTADNERTGTFKVRVLDSPVGGMNLDKAVIVEYNDKDLQSALGRLERRELDTEGLVMLGRTLAAMLLPITAQDGVTLIADGLFLRSPWPGRTYGHGAWMAQRQSLADRV